MAHSAKACSLFCPECHTLLKVPDPELIVRCYACPFKCPLGELNKRWQAADRSEQHVQVMRTHKEESEESETDTEQTGGRAKVRETCPKCSHPELYYSTAQLRSVDEGQTVFYECPKCGHTYATNT